MENQYDFDQLSKALTDVNNAIGIVNNGASLLGSVQQKALHQLNELAQAYQKLLERVQKLEDALVEKDNRIMELESWVEGIKREQEHGEKE